MDREEMENILMGMQGSEEPVDKQANQVPQSSEHRVNGPATDSEVPPKQSEIVTDEASRPKVIPVEEKRKHRSGHKEC